MSAPRISVIVPARDAEATLGKTLASVTSQELDEPFELIVIDNGSRDGTAALADRAAGVTRVVRRVRGDGPGAARNVGVDAAAGSLLVFLDSDCWAGPGWLAAGVRSCEEADLVQGRVLPDPGAALGPFDRTLSIGAAYGLFETANLFVGRSSFELAGGFPEGLEAEGEAPFGEDALFGWRARRAGARTAFCAEALAYHAVVPRGAAGFVRERARLALFPELAARVPELRAEFFYRRWWLSRRTAAFDLALAGAGAAVVSRRWGALAAAAPYGFLVATEARRWGVRRGPVVAGLGVLADAVGAAALAAGSVRARTVVA